MPGLAHKLQDFIGNMLRCYSQLTADVIFHKFIKKSFIRVCHQIIKPNAGTDKNFFDFGDVPYLSEKLKIILVVYRQILTRRRKQALPLLADSFCQLLFAGRITEISRGASYIMDIAFKIRILCHLFSFFQNGIMTSRLKDTALMKGQRTEITASKASSVAGQTEFDLFQCRNPAFFLIHGMILSRIRQIVNIVHFHLRQRLRWWILYHISTVPIRFCQRLCCKWICVSVLNGKAVRISFFIGLYLFK